MATESSSGAATPIVVLGIGNPIMGDDGIGLALLHRLQQWFAGVDPSRITSQDDLDVWRPTSKAGPTNQVADPGLIVPRPVEPQGQVGFVDGGTAGMELLDVIADTDRLLVLDAVTGPGDPGDVVVLHGDQLPRLLQSKLSPHQVGLLDLLAAADLIGARPKTVAVVGIVAQSAQLNVGMSTVVTASLPQATRAAAQLLSTWIEDQTALDINQVPGMEG